MKFRTEICIGRTFVDRCIELLNEKKLDTATASMAKYWLTDLQGKVADECVQLHGGWGFMWEFPGIYLLIYFITFILLYIMLYIYILIIFNNNNNNYYNNSCSCLL